VVVVVLAIAGVFSGGNSGAGSAATTSQSATNNENLTRIALLPTAGQKAAGQAIFARAGDQPFLQITLTGLSGSVPQGKVYVPWLYIKRSQAFPVGILRVDKSGNATGQVAIPQQVVSLLPTFKSLVVSLSDAKVVSADLRGASQKGNFPSFSGQEILVGKIPGR
jgi:hypothetical protein